MIQELTPLLLFCFVLFIYLHIQYQYKVNSDLEILQCPQFDSINSWEREQFFDIRQPTLFSSQIITFPCPDPLGHISITDAKDNVDYQFPLHQLCQNQHYPFFSHHNHAFLEQTRYIQQIQNEYVLKPPMTCRCSYDILFGSKDTKTTPKYNIDYRTFYSIVCPQENAHITVFCSPPNSTIDVCSNYEHMEFTTKMEHISKNMITFTLYPKQILYVPAYWWVSFQFNTHGTGIAELRYNTYMNVLANIHHLCLWKLQNQNVYYKQLPSIASSIACDASKDKQENI